MAIVATITSGTSSGTWTQVKALNQARSLLTIQNRDSTDDFLVGVDAAPGSDDNAIKVTADGSWTPQAAPINSIWIKAVSGTPKFAIIEG